MYSLNYIDNNKIDHVQRAFENESPRPVRCQIIRVILDFISYVINLTVMRNRINTTLNIDATKKLRMLYTTGITYGSVHKTR